MSRQPVALSSTASSPRPPTPPPSGKADTAETSCSMSQQGAFSAGLVPRDFSGMPIEEMLARLEELEVDIMACDPLAGPVMSVRRLQDALYIGLELVSRNGKLEREVQELTEELKSQKECCVSLLKRAPEVRAACGTRVEAYASGSMCRSIIERTVQHHKMAKELYESLCEDDTTASMTTLWSAMEPVQDSQNLVLRASTTGSTFVQPLACGNSPSGRYSTPVRRTSPPPRCSSPQQRATVGTSPWRAPTGSPSSSMRSLKVRCHGNQTRLLGPAEPTQARSYAQNQVKLAGSSEHTSPSAKHRALNSGCGIAEQPVVNPSADVGVMQEIINGLQSAASKCDAFEDFLQKTSASLKESIHSIACKSPSQETRSLRMEGKERSEVMGSRRTMPILYGERSSPTCGRRARPGLPAASAVVVPLSGDVSPMPPAWRVQSPQRPQAVSEALVATPNVPFQVRSASSSGANSLKAPPANWRPPAPVALSSPGCFCAAVPHINR